MFPQLADVSVERVFTAEESVRIRAKTSGTGFGLAGMRRHGCPVGSTATMSGGWLTAPPAASPKTGPWLGRRQRPVERQRRRLYSWLAGGLACGGDRKGVGG